MRLLRSHFRAASRCVLVAFFLVSLSARGQEKADAKRQEELRYVDGLTRLGLTEYAQLVLSRLGSGPEVEARQLDGALGRGQFPDVLAIIAAKPDQESLTVWAMKLKLADGYFAWGKYAEARQIYDAFFAKYASGAPAELKNFYFESVYKYAQMLLMMNDPQAALKAYRLGLAANPERDMKRQFQGDLADLVIKIAESAPANEREAYLKELDTLTGELLWVQDLWFGKAIVIKAHVALLRGKVDEAMEYVDEYRDELSQIDAQLQEQSPDGELTRYSPMAEARYLLGSILLDEGKKALAAGNTTLATEMLAGKEVATQGQKPHKLPGAFAHFMNVFIRYPNTKWAMDAGAKAEEARTILERDLKKSVTVKVEPAQWAKIEEEQARSAKATLNLQQYPEAAEQYLAILSRFPQSQNAVGMLGDLVTCYIELKEDLYADTVMSYLAERYNRNKRFGTAAGNLVLSFASAYGERGRADRKDAVYEIYFKHFTEHPMAAQLLFSFGDRRLKEEDVPGAMVYYERVVKNHARSPVSFLALSKMALCYERTGDVTNQIKTLQAYVDRADQAKRLNHELIRVLYRLGDAYRKLGPAYFGAAIKRFQDLDQRLATARDSYQSNADEAARNQQFLEASMYYRGVCYAMAPPPKDRPDDVSFKKAALQVFTDLAQKYPKSTMAPAALSQVGTLWTVLGNSEEAEKAFSRLKADYPDSAEARNVDFLLGMSLLKMGKRAEAVKVFKGMFGEAGGKFSEGQILTAGEELLKAKEYEIALQAYERVLAGAKPDDRAKVEPALAGKGQSLVALGRHAEGIAALEDLFKRYPRSAYTVPGMYALSGAYAEQASQEADGDKRFDEFNKALKSMKEVMKYDTSTGRRGAVTLEIGRINELKAKAEGQFGTPENMAKYRDAAIATYQTMIQFEKASDPAMRPHLDEAYFRCMRLFLESERWQDLYDDTGRYQSQFPNGKYVQDIRQWRTRANAQLAGAAAAAGTAAPAPGPAAPVVTPAPETAAPAPAATP